MKSEAYATAHLPQLIEVKNELPVSEFVQYLKHRGPIFYSEPDRFWVVSDRDLASAVLKGDGFSAERSSAFLQPKCPFHKVANFFGLVKKMMVNSDAPEHTARRKLAQHGVSEHVIDGFEGRVRAIVESTFARIHDALVQGDSIDFVELIAMPIPNRVLADLFLIPERDRGLFFQRANAMTQFFGGGSQDIESDASRANAAAAELRTYFTQLISERRIKPADDFISHLLRQQAGLGLDDDEVISQSVLMFVAGTVTTSDQMANVLNVLLTTKDVWEHLRTGRLTIEKACEEATRLDPSVSFLFRRAKMDQTLGSVKIRKDDLIFVSTAACNQDGNERFDFVRPGRPHLSYGFGSHYCLGARLGRIQIQTVIEMLIKTNSDYCIESKTRKNQSLGFSGFESLILRAGRGWA